MGSKAMWDKWAPVSGILYTVLYVVAFALVGNGPKADKPASDVVSFFANHHGRVEAGLTIFAFALFFLVWWLATVAAILRKAGEARLASTAYGAGVVIAGIFVLFGVVYGSLAFSAPAGNADVAGAVYALQWPLYVIIPPLAALLSLSVSAAGMRTKLLPAWLGWIGLLAAIAFAVASTTWSTSGFWSPGGGYGVITEFVFLGWIFVTSVMLLVKPAPAGM